MAGGYVPKLFLSSSRDAVNVLPPRTDSICCHQYTLAILMHQQLGHILNIPTCNFHIDAIVSGATHNTFVAENRNIIVNGNSAVK